jgi:protease secretion system outer membrane protein
VSVGVAFPTKSSVRALLALATCLGTNAHAMGLMEAYEAAVVNDPVYRAARHEYEASQQYRSLGRSNLLPQVSASYTRLRNHADIETATIAGPVTTRPSYTSIAGSLQVRQPVFYPEGRAKDRQGAAQSQAGEAVFAQRSQEIIVRVVAAFVEAHHADDQLRQVRAQREAYLEARASAQRLRERGEGTVTEVLEAQARLDGAEAQVIEATDLLSQARQELAAIIGRPVDQLDPLVRDFRPRPMQPASFNEWRELAIANSPELQAQRRIVDIALEEVNKARAGYLPRLDLLATAYRNQSDTTNTINQLANVVNIGVQLTVPIYSGGAIDASTAQAVANHAKAQADLDAKVTQVEVELRKQYNLNLSSLARIDAAASAQRSAASAVEATVRSVRGGQRTSLDVLNAQRLLFETERDLALARYSYLLAHTRLRHAAGLLGADDLGDVASYFRP